MQLMFAGSGGSIVTKERACPCIIIDKDVMIDCGSGSLRNLRQANVDLGKIRKLLITHMHWSSYDENQVVSLLSNVYLHGDPMYSEWGHPQSF